PSHPRSLTLHDALPICPLLFPRAVDTTRTVLVGKDEDVDKSAAESEQAQRVGLDTAQFFVVEHDTANTTVLGQDSGLRLDLLCGDRKSTRLNSSHVSRS